MTQLAETARPAEAQPPARTGAGVYVGIATRGRPDQAREVVARLRRQTLQPAGVLVVGVEPADVVGLSSGDGLQVLQAASGLTRQRNAVLDHLPGDAKYVVYFDDDFLPDDAWLEAVVTAFEANPSLAGVTGNVVADGILGPGLTVDEGEAALARADRSNLGWRLDDYSPYGCNMAFRVSMVKDLRFDERLVLYGWLEDRDFGSRIAAGGRLIKLGAALGVHLGVKKGRVSGRRLGYSQIANVSYMLAKGTMSRREALTQALRNVCANLAKSPWAETYIDRRGRLLGNGLAVVDLMRGVCTPEHAERL